MRSGSGCAQHLLAASTDTCFHGHPKGSGVRALARKTDLSPAAVSLSLRRLGEMGFLEKAGREIRLHHREDLLEEWVSFYRPRFRRQAESRFYAHARGAEAIIGLLRSQPVAKVNGYGLSVHAGASLVAPFVQFREVHIYVEPPARAIELRLIRSLEAKKAEAEANLIFVEPFYKESFLFESRAIRGVRVVSDLQLYLDLRVFPTARSRASRCGPGKAVEAELVGPMRIRGFIQALRLSMAGVWLKSLRPRGNWIRTRDPK